MLLVHVVDQLAAHTGLDDAVGKSHAVVTMAVEALVGSTARLAAHVDAGQGRLEPGLPRLWEQPLVVLHHLGEGGDIHGTIREELPGLCWLAPLLGLGDQDVSGFLAKEIADALDLREVLLRDVGVTGIRSVILAVGRQTLRDTNARAVELTDNPFLVLGFRALRGGVDEVRRPPQWDGLLSQAECWHDLRQVVLEEVVGQVLETLLLGAVVSVDRAGAADGADAAFLWLLVDDADKRVTHHVVAQLAFDNSRAETLVHQLTAGLLATLQILADALGSPGTTFASAAAHAELDELSDGVLFRVVVVGLHEVQHLVVTARALAIGLAVVS
mmetsp:Transcript_44388/g.91767  ORF Transcript_44388/g.91767 Transcript_44388/m.91767 type:complete len:329 (-) Transcript_44388:26-1012(-)